MFLESRATGLVEFGMSLPGSLRSRVLVLQDEAGVGLGV